MRVLIVSNLFPPAFIGGYELAAQDVATMLVARGHRVTVLSSAALDGQADPPMPFTLLRTLECLVAQIEVIAPEDLFHRGLGLNLRNLAAVAKAAAAEGPEVILCFNLAGLGPLGLLRLFGSAGPPAVLMLMDNPFVFAEQDPAMTLRLRSLLGLPPGLGGVTTISCSAALTREISGLVGAALDLPVIPAWTTTGAPPPQAHDGPIRFVFASRIAPHKGMMLVVEAAALVHARGVPFTVDVWGAGFPAEMMQAAHAAGAGRAVPVSRGDDEAGDGRALQRLRRAAVPDLGARALRLRPRSRRPLQAACRSSRATSAVPSSCWMGCTASRYGARRRTSRRQWSGWPPCPRRTFWRCAAGCGGMRAACSTRNAGSTGWRPCCAAPSRRMRGRWSRWRMPYSPCRRWPIFGGPRMPESDSAAALARLEQALADERRARLASEARWRRHCRP